MTTLAQGMISIASVMEGYTASLTNDSVSIATDKDGNNPVLNGAFTTISLALGATTIPAYTLTYPKSFVRSGCALSVSGTTITLTDVSADTGYVDIPIYSNSARTSEYLIATKRFSFAKAKQGNNGVNALTGFLTNETSTVPTDKDGNSGVFTTATTTMKVYNGATDDSANWTFAASPSTGVTGNLSTGTGTYTVSAMTQDSGYVDITASRSGYANIVKRFTITKNKAGLTGGSGASATSYWLVASSPVIAKTIAGVYTPSTITITGKSQVGTNSPANYAGRFIISDSIDGSTFVDRYTSSANESTKTYTPLAGIKSLKIKFYLAGGTTTLLDEQTIQVVADSSDIQIGGKNLIKNTSIAKDLVGWTLGTGISRDTTFLNNGMNTINFNISGLTSNRWYSANPTAVEGIAGQAYTASCELFVPSENNIDGTFGLDINYFNSAGDRIGFSANYMDKTITDKWQKPFVTGIAPVGTVKVSAWVWCQKNGHFWVSKIKLEKGNKATDWTPAPEDIDSAIDNIQVGGRNLIIESKLSSYPPYNSTPTVLNHVISTTRKVDTFLTFEITNFIPENIQYVLSGILKCNGNPVTNAMLTQKRASSYSSSSDSFYINDTTGEFRIVETYSGSKPWILHTLLTGAIGDVITIERFKMEKGNKPTDWTPAPEDVATDIATANTAAANAQTDASSALTKISDISTDDILAPSEKLSVRKEWETIAGEKASLDSQADLFGVSRTSYDSKFVKLGTYLNAGVAYSSGIPSWIADVNLKGNTPITGSTFRTTFTDYYNAKVDLLNAIAAATKTYAENIQVGGRNLVLGSGNYSPNKVNTWIIDSVTHWSKLVYNGYTRFTKLTTSVGSWIRIPLSMNLEASTAYTATIKFRRSVASNAILYIATLGSTNSPEAIGGITPSAANEFTTLTMSFTTLSTNKNCLVFTSSHFTTIGETFDVEIIKIEKGNKPTDWTPAPEDVDVAIDNIQIGGKNLIKNTSIVKDSVGWELRTGITRDTTFLNNGMNTFNFNITGQTSDAWSLINPTTVNGIVGQQYTASCEAYIPSGNGIDGTMGAGMDINYYNSAGARLDFTTIPLDKTIVDKWQKVSVTGTAPAGTSKINAWVWCQKNGHFWISHPKLELGNKATDWSPAPEDNDTAISSAVNSIKIGGKNILFGTKDFNSSWNIYDAIIDTTKYLGFNVLYKDNSSATSGFADMANQYVFAPSIENRIQNGEWYTLSFFVKGTGVFHTYVYPSVGDSSAKPIVDGVESSSGAQSDNAKAWALTDSWTRHTYTFKVSSAARTSAQVLFRAVYGNIVYVCGAKLEKGNKATDWSPAPEDVDNAIDNIQVGGRNYARYSGGTYLDKAGLFSNDRSRASTTIIDGKTCLQLLNTSTTPFIRFLDIPILADAVYTFSIWIKGTTNHSATLHQWNGTSYDTRTFNITTSWAKYSFTFTAKTTYDIVHLYNFTETTYIADWKFELGNKATDWTPASEDIASDIATAQTTANRKSIVFYQATAPSTDGRVVGDTWFDTDDGNKIYKWSGTAWEATQFGTNAIANSSITNALIADATIESAKIASLDAGRITTGYISADRIAAGTITADKLIIGSGEQGGYLANSRFTKWDTSYPTGTSIWSSGGISKQLVDSFYIPQFNCPVSGTQYGMILNPPFFANGINLDGLQYFCLELRFRLTSGTSANGAVLLVDIRRQDNTTERMTLPCSIAGAALTTNTWYTIRKIFELSSVNVAKTFKSISGFLLANYGENGAIKTIQFASVNMYQATKQDYLSQTWTTADSTTINGGMLETGTVTADKIIVGNGEVTQGNIAAGKPCTSLVTPYSTTITVASSAGATSLTVASVSYMTAGLTQIKIGSEYRKVTAINGLVITLESALTSAYSASTSLTHNKYYTITDGNNTVGSDEFTFGTGNRTNNSGEAHYIQLDLGADYRIGESRLFFYSGNNRSYYYKIKYSTDENNWNYAVGNSSKTGWAMSTPPVGEGRPAYNPTVNTFAIPIVARYLRVYGNGNTSNVYNTLYEWELYSGPRTTINGGQISGGTLSLGGGSNGDGVLSINDSSGVEVVRGDNSGLLVNGGSYRIKDEFGNICNALSSSNLITNGGFELYFNGTLDSDNHYLSTKIEGWTPTGSIRIANIGSASGLPQSCCYDGESSVTMKDTGGIGQGFRAFAGTTYTVSFCARLNPIKSSGVSSGGVKVNLRKYNESGVEETVPSYTKTFTLNQSWTRCIYTFTASNIPANGSTPAQELDVLGMTLTSTNSSWIMIDCVQVVEGSLPCLIETASPGNWIAPERIENGDFSIKGTMQINNYHVVSSNAPWKIYATYVYITNGAWTVVDYSSYNFTQGTRVYTTASGGVSGQALTKNDTLTSCYVAFPGTLSGYIYVLVIGI